MSEPILIENDQLEELDISTDVVSEAIPLQAGVGYCIMSVNDGAAIGVASLQVSPDSVIWFDLPGTELDVDGTGNTNVWNVERAMYPYARLSYVSTSDTGTMNIFVSVKSN
jgi:hypothetical protein